MKKQIHLIAKGTVQGVGFRATTRHFASALGLIGTVRNLPDGSVEIFAQGTQESLDELIRKLKNHFGASIESLQSADTSLGTFSGFNITQ